MAGNRGLLRYAGAPQPGAFPWQVIHGYGTSAQRPAACAALTSFIYAASDANGGAGALYQVQLVSGAPGWVQIASGAYTFNAPLTVSSGAVSLNYSARFTVSGGNLELANSGVTAGTSGSASQSLTATVDVYGRLTALSAQAIQITESQVTNLVSDLAAKAPLASPAFTGTPTAPTPAAADNSTKVATTAWVVSQGYSTSGASGANPTASVGLTAVNGTATTFMRSDAAPPLDVTVSPGWTGTHTFNPSGSATLFTRTQAATSTPVNPAAFRARSSVTPAAGFGCQVNYVADDNTNTPTNVAGFAAVWVDPGSASYRGRMTANVYGFAAGTVEAMRWEVTSGNVAGLGFFGATAVARQSGDMSTGLANLGLFSGTPTFNAANLTGTVPVARLPVTPFIGCALS